MAVARKELIPLEDLFGSQSKSWIMLSPDGRHFADIRPSDGGNNIFIRETVPGSEARQVTHLKNGWLHFPQWAMDSRHVIYREQGGGDENYRFQAVDFHTGENRFLTPARGADGHPVQALMGFHLNRNVSPRRPDVFLAAMNLRDLMCFDLYEVSLVTGEHRLIAEGTRKLRKWLVDMDLNVRGVLKETPDGGLTFDWCHKPGGGFIRLLEWQVEDEFQVLPLAVTPDGKLLIQDSAGRDTSALVELDPVTMERRELLSDPEYDIAGVHLDPLTGGLEAGVIFGEMVEFTVFSEDARADYQWLMEKFAPGRFGIADRTVDNRRWLVRSYNSHFPSQLHYFDRDSRDCERIDPVINPIEQYELPQTRPVQFTARDGVKLHAYLTIPFDYDRPGPLVMLTHGGPWERDYWNYDPEVQWLANRGYAVLQVNFRGSKGFGKRFIELAKREWGGAMQDDITDGKNWAVEQGIADPRRTVIMGMSFGGYAAMAGAALTPGVYAGAVSLCGISNLLSAMANERPHWESQRRRWDMHCGRLPRYEDGDRKGEYKSEKDYTEEDAAEIAYLKSRSPLFQAHKVECPMLIGHGENDPRCPVAESKLFAEELRKNGVDVELAVYPNEGHWLALEEHRLDFYRRAEAFLKKVLGRDLST